MWGHYKKNHQNSPLYAYLANFKACLKKYWAPFTDFWGHPKVCPPCWKNSCGRPCTRPLEIFTRMRFFHSAVSCYSTHNPTFDYKLFIFKIEQRYRSIFLLYFSNIIILKYQPQPLPHPCSHPCSHPCPHHCPHPCPFPHPAPTPAPIPDLQGLTVPTS